MRITYDPEVDAVYIYLTDKQLPLETLRGSGARSWQVMPEPGYVAHDLPGTA